jgi:hypothetical protein
MLDKTEKNCDHKHAVVLWLLKSRHYSERHLKFYVCDISVKEQTRWPISKQCASGAADKHIWNYETLEQEKNRADQTMKPKACTALAQCKPKKYQRQ